MANSSITIEELQSFHGIDRRIFHRMVNNLHRVPRICMEIIAMWLWWESIGYPSLISSLLEYPDIILDAFLEEAIVGLYYLGSETPPYPIIDGMRLTAKLLLRPISPQYLFENRVRGRSMISKTVNDIFIIAFDDIIKKAVAVNGMVKREPPQVLTSTDGRTFIFQNGNTIEFIVPHSVKYPKLPSKYHPSPIFPVMQSLQSREASTSSGQASFHATAEERALLLTFPRGSIITYNEVRDFFGSIYGDVVESIEMTSVSGKVILRSAVVVANIFQGDRMKVFVNGKEVWIKKMGYADNFLSVGTAMEK